MNNIKLFEEKKVRSQWDEKEEQWYFAIVDVVKIVPIVSECSLSILELLRVVSLMLIFLRKSMLFLKDVNKLALLAINVSVVVID